MDSAMTYKTALAYFNRQDKKTQLAIMCCFQSFNDISKVKMSDVEKDFVRSVTIAQSWAKRWPDKYSAN